MSERKFYVTNYAAICSHCKHIVHFSHAVQFLVIRLIPNTASVAYIDQIKAKALLNSFQLASIIIVHGVRLFYYK